MFKNEIHYDREVVLVDDLLQALLKFDEITTSALLNEAFSIYATEKSYRKYCSSSVK